MPERIPDPHPEPGPDDADRWQPPRAAMPGLVAQRLILANRPTIAAWLEGLRAWPEGLAFELCVAVPPGSFRTDDDGYPAIDFDLRHPRDRSHLFEMGIRSGGRSASNADETTWPGREPGPREFVLAPQAGGGGGSDETGGDWRIGWWLTPLPTDGPVEFWCRWPLGGLDRHSVRVDVAVLTDAAARTVPLWPAG